MSLRLALATILPVLDKTILQMSMANQTPEQRIKFNRLQQAVKYLKEYQPNVKDNDGVK